MNENERMVENITTWLFKELKANKIPLWKCSEETGIGLESLKYAKKNNKMTITQIVLVCHLLNTSVKQVIDKIDNRKE